MWRFVFRQAGEFLLSLLGAGLAAGALAAGHGARQAGDFIAALAARCNGFLHLDFGASSLNGLPALAVVARGIPATLELVVAGAIIALAAGIPLGLAFGRGSARRILAPFAQIAASAPVFCAGLALAWIAADLLHWPAGAGGNVGAAFGLVPALVAHNTVAAMAGLRTLLFPALTVGAAGAAAVHLALRRAGADASNEPYRLGLRLMGLRAAEIERVYVLPQVLAGLLANAGEIALALIAAAAVAEWVFGWPGVAVLFVKSVALADWNVAALILLLFAGLKFAADFAGAIAARLIFETAGPP